MTEGIKKRIENTEQICTTINRIIKNDTINSLIGALYDIVKSITDIEGDDELTDLEQSIKRLNKETLNILTKIEIIHTTTETMAKRIELASYTRNKP